MTMIALDQPSDCGYRIYSEQKEVLEEMVNRMGYNFTVTSAVRKNDRLEITVKNTGLAPAFFDITLAAEMVGENGGKVGNFGEPVLIEKGSFREETEQTFVFTHDGGIADDTALCLAMYENGGFGDDNSAPSVKFDNLNTRPDNRLALVNKFTCAFGWFELP